MCKLARILDEVLPIAFALSSGSNGVEVSGLWMIKEVQSIVIRRQQNQLQVVFSVESPDSQEGNTHILPEP
jgi:hypothetical protein